MSSKLKAYVSNQETSYETNLAENNLKMLNKKIIILISDATKNADLMSRVDHLCSKC